MGSGDSNQRSDAGSDSVAGGHLLAVSTSGSACSVALLTASGGSIEIDSAADAPAITASEIVLGLIDGLLKGRGITLTEIDAFALDVGPGSFTGVRIGCAVVQGLAWGVDRPVVPVGALEAMALQAAGPGGSCRVFVAADARMGEVYHAVYDVDASGGITTPAEPVVAAPESACVFFDASTTPVDACVAGDGFERYPALAAWQAIHAARPCDVVRPDAALIARIGWSRWRQGRYVAAAAAAPTYVRDRVAHDVDEQRRLRGLR